MSAIGQSMVEVRGGGDPEFIGPYRVYARLGTGGFGTVYAARADGRARQYVAVKVVHPYVAEDSADFRGRFDKEVRAIQRVKSDCVPAFVDSDSSANPPWLVTELVPGLSLAKVVDRCGPLPEAAVWRLGAGITEALTVIHTALSVHRDLKPQNVLLVPDRPWIIDFGLAHLSELHHLSSSRRPMATFQYAAPEQLKGLERAAEPADVFELGGTLLFAATGHAPHAANSLGELFTRAATERPDLAGLRRGRLRYLIERCLRYVAEDRPTVAELREEFSRPPTGHDSGGGFERVLPREVIRLLDDFQGQLEEVLGGRGPARLGWRVAGEGPEPAEVPGEQAGASPLDRIDLNAEQDSPRPAARTRLSALWPGRDRMAGARQDQGAAADSDGARGPGLEQPAGTSTGQARGRLPRDDQGWRREFESWICGPVAVDGETCVVTGRDGTVRGVHASDGRKDRWRVDIGGPVSGAAVILSTGFGFEGAAFVAGHDGSLRQINLSTGDSHAVLPPGPPIEGSPAVVQDRDALRNIVYVVRADGGIYAIDPRTEKAEEIHRLADGASGALAATPEVVAVADAKGTVYALNAEDGSVIRKVGTDGQVFAAPVLTADWLYVASTDGLLRAARLGDAVDGPCDGAHLGAPLHTDPVWSGGRLCVGAGDGRVHSFDIPEHPNTGPDGRWASDSLLTEIVGLSAAEGSASLYAAAGYRVVELDARNGRLARVLLTMNCLISAAPVISDGFGYIAGLGGVVERVSLR